MDKLEKFKLQTKEIKHLATGKWTSILASLAPEIGKAADGFNGARRPAIKCPYHNAKSKTSFRFLKKVTRLVVVAVSLAVSGLMAFSF